ncbi:MAG: LacI family DNA-binding transcriptional regulator [Tepidisphaeraceae bacterium]
MASVSVTDIARRVGVAQSTVSAALHGRGRVGRECRDRILATAKALGYEPRVAAQLLRALRTGQLGVIVAATDAPHAFLDEIPRLVVGHFVQACLQKDYRYMIDFHHHAKAAGHFTPPRLVTAKLVDGTILVGDVGEELRQWLHHRQTHPWVSIEEPADHCVLSAAESGVDEAVRMLAGLGHRVFAYAGGPERYSQHRLGYQGFRQAVRELGFRGEVVAFPGGLTAERAREVLAWARALMSRSIGGDNPRPTAFVCHGESISRAVVHAATERGLSVPGDLSVTSYGSVGEATRRYPHLTTIENDYTEMTGIAMQMLWKQIAGEAVPTPCVWVKPRLVPGETTGPAPIPGDTAKENPRHQLEPAQDHCPGDN